MLLQKACAVADQAGQRLQRRIGGDSFICFAAVHAPIDRRRVEYCRPDKKTARRFCNRIKRLRRDISVRNVRYKVERAAALLIARNIPAAARRRLFAERLRLIHARPFEQLVVGDPSAQRGNFPARQRRQHERRRGVAVCKALFSYRRAILHKRHLINPGAALQKRLRRCVKPAPPPCLSRLRVQVRPDLRHGARALQFQRQYCKGGLHIIPAYDRIKQHGCHRIRRLTFQRRINIIIRIRSCRHKAVKRRRAGRFKSQPRSRRPCLRRRTAGGRKRRRRCRIRRRLLRLVRAARRAARQYQQGREHGGRLHSLEMYHMQSLSGRAYSTAAGL